MQRDLFLEAQLLFLECLDFRSIGRGAVHLFTQATVEPFMLLLEGLDVRSFHGGSLLYSLGRKSPARVVTHRGNCNFDSRDGSRGVIVIKP